ncbi:KICSTOR complex protein C12orf66 -like protein [Sarcoptes scabiei]|nr:KICSTOR complex protein C12orf66 -like protein [Sarcoptes scabiei]
MNNKSIQNVELILEQFLDYHIVYQWDKAKEYLEYERDQFRTKNSHSIITNMLNCLLQLIVADRNYLSLQFFSSKVFQRKDQLRITYENLRTEFGRLEERSNQIFLRLNPTSSNCNSFNEPNNFSNNFGSKIPNAARLDSEPAKDALDCLEIFSDVDEKKIKPIFSNPNYLCNSWRDSSEAPSPSKPNNGFLSKFLKKFSSIHSITPSDSPSLSDNYEFSIGEETVQIDTLLFFSIDQFAGHICGQLTNYCKIRVEMIDFYEKLTSFLPVSSDKLCVLEDCLSVLNGIQERADDSFHHPVLSKIKAMLMFECNVLLSLLKANSHLQKWQYLETLFCLQDAHNKINRLSNPKEYSLGYSLSMSPFLPVSSALSTRNRASNANSLNSSSANLSNLPYQMNTGNQNMMSSHQKDGLSSALAATASKNLFQRAYFETKSIPMLIQWFIKYKLFLLSKYSFYFHSLLLVHLTPIQSSSNSVSQSITSSTSLSSLLSQNSNMASNCSQAEIFIKNVCAKYFIYDFHTKIVQFFKKLDSSQIVLILNAHGIDVSMTGYKSPFIRKEHPQGRDSMPIIYSYPIDSNFNRHPTLIMIMNNRMKELDNGDSVVIEHDSKMISNSEIDQIETNTVIQLPVTYYMIRPDPSYTLALVCESKRSERDAHIVAFLKEMLFSLRDNKIFANLKAGNLNR